MKRLQKIYYVPGIFSAIFIPLVFWYLGNQRIQPKQYFMDLGIPAKFKKENYDNTFEPFRNWNYQKIVVPPNSAIRNQNFYVSELKKLQHKNQKKTGIEFIINDNNTYQDFIALIDVMKLAKQETYGLDLEKTGHLFAVHFYKNSNKIQRGYDVVNNDTVYYRVPEDYYLKGFEKFTSKLSKLPKQAFFIIFGYLLLLNISVFSLVRKSI